MYLSFRNQSIDGWFLYDRAFRHEWVKENTLQDLKEQWGSLIKKLFWNI